MGIHRDGAHGVYAFSLSSRLWSPALTRPLRSSQTSKRAMSTWSTSMKRVRSFLHPLLPRDTDYLSRLGIEHFAFSKRRAASYKDFHRRRHAGIEDLCEIEALLIDVCHFATALLDATTPKRTFAAYEPTRDELERMLEEVAWRNDWTGKEWARIREVLF